MGHRSRFGAETTPVCACVFVCADSVMSLLRELGRGYQALCSYNCRDAINILTSLPPQHYNTGWVLTHIGRAYFELAEYTQVTCRMDTQLVRC